MYIYIKYISFTIYEIAYKFLLQNTFFNFFNKRFLNYENNFYNFQFKYKDYYLNNNYYIYFQYVTINKALNFK